MRKQLVGMTALLGLLVGCAHAKIPGTDIEDNKDTRAIIALMDRYRSALEAKDVQEIKSLLSPQFREGGGSSSPDDDLDYANFILRMTPRLNRVVDLRVAMDVKRVEIKGQLAVSTYYFNSNYKLPSYTSKVQADSDLKQMSFIREGGMWRILAGI